MEIRVTGLANLERNLNRIRNRVPENAERALFEVGGDLSRRSKELAPLDTSALRSSGTFEVEGDRNEKTLVVGFNEAYALIQHENLEFRHPLGGQAKYLQMPFEANINRYMRHIGTAIGRAVE